MERRPKRSRHQNAVSQGLRGFLPLDHEAASLKVSMTIKKGREGKSPGENEEKQEGKGSVSRIPELFVCFHPGFSALEFLPCFVPAKELRDERRGLPSSDDLEREIYQHSHGHVFFEEALFEQLERRDRVVGHEANLGDEVDDDERLDIWRFCNTMEHIRNAQKYSIDMMAWMMMGMRAKRTMRKQETGKATKWEGIEAMVKGGTTTNV